MPQANSQTTHISLLIYYAPTLIRSTLAWIRHGKRFLDTWSLLALFCALRIVGASLCLVANAQSPGDLDAGPSTLDFMAKCFAAMGPMLLLLSMAELLIEAKEWVRRADAVGEWVWGVVFVAHGVVSVLAVWGLMKREARLYPWVAIIIGVVFTVQAYIAGVYYRGQRRGEGGSLGIVLGSVPFLGVRVVYGIVWSLLERDFGGVVAGVLMRYGSEIVVVGMYLHVGTMDEPGRKIVGSK